MRQLTFLLCFGWFFGESQGTYDIMPNTQELDSIVQSALPNKEGPGLAVIIAQGDDVLYEKGFGLANIEHQIPFTTATISDLGSVAKQFTAFAIAMLADEGKLGLDDPITRYFPDAPDFGITIRHMIHHLSGLREIYTMKSLAGNPRSGISQFEAQELLLRSDAVNFEPGSDYAYCNTGYMLLADIIVQVSNTSFEPFMQDRIFRPLGMNDTYIMDIQGETFPNRADSYRFDPEYGWVQVYDVSSAYGQGGMYASLTDVKKWLDNFRTQKVGSKAVHELIVRPAVLTDGSPTDYAFGMVSENWQGVERLLHTGSSAGYRAYVAYYPAFDLAIMFKGNWDRLNSIRLGNRLLEALLKEKLQKTNLKPEQSVNGVIDNAPPYTPDQLDEFTGAFYSEALDITYTLSYYQETLELSKGKISNHLLEKEKIDQFEVEGIGKLTFVRDDAGSIIGFYIHTPGVRHLWFAKK